MTEQQKSNSRGVGSLIALVTYGLPVLVLGLCARLMERTKSLGGDDRGLETLEVGLIIAMALGVLLIAINNLGGSLSGFFGRLVAKINSLG
jgi:Flp pilus assembly pilin Flp